MTLTPEQFNKLATKEDLKNLEEKMPSKGDFNNMMNAIDGIAGQFDKIDQESKMDKLAHDRMQGEIDQIKGHLDLKATS